MKLRKRPVVIEFPDTIEDIKLVRRDKDHKTLLLVLANNKPAWLDCELLSDFHGRGTDYDRLMACLGQTFESRCVKIRNNVLLRK